MDELLTKVHAYHEFLYMHCNLSEADALLHSSPVDFHRLEIFDLWHSALEQYEKTFSEYLDILGDI